MESSKLWAVAALLNMTLVGTAQAQTENCVADLSREDICLDRQHAEGGSSAPLTFTWEANTGLFDLTAKTCFGSDVTEGALQDMVIAIDRSQSIWGLDAARKKQGLDAISASRTLIEKYVQAAAANPNQAAQLGLMLYSSNDACTAYNDQPLNIDREFPCVFIPAGSAGDTAHVQRLQNLLDRAEGRYSQGGLAVSADPTIPVKAATSGSFALGHGDPATLLMLTDGRAYAGDTGDTYAYLRQSSYDRTNLAVNNASAAGTGSFNLLFGLQPLASPLYERAQHGDAFDTMCALTPDEPDCADTIDAKEPAQWLVNGFDEETRVASWLEAYGQNKDAIVTINNTDNLDQIITKSKHGRPIDQLPSSAVLTFGGADYQAAIDGARMTLINLPLATDPAAALRVQVGDETVTMPLNLTVTKSDNPGAFTAGAMSCQAGAQPFTGPNDLSLDDLQGGSGSCSAVFGGSAKHASPLLLLLMLSPALLLIVRSRFVAATGAALAMMILSLGSTPAEAKELGLNSQHFAPVADGVAQSEKATIPAPLSVHAGVFMDYANDPLELADDKGERKASVVDDMVTAHFVGSVGIMRRMSLDLRLPFVHKTDLDRSVEGDEMAGGQLGQPADARVGLKFGVIAYKSMTVSLMPVVTVATGDPEMLLGDGRSNYGLRVLTSGKSGRLAWASSAGYMQREKPLVLSDDRANEIMVRGQGHLSGGLEYQVLRWLSLGGGLDVRPSAGDGLSLGKASPAEWHSQAKLQFGSVNTIAGFGTGIGKGYGAPDYRAFAGVTYTPRPQAKPRPVVRRAKTAPRQSAKPIVRTSHSKTK